MKKCLNEFLQNAAFPALVLAFAFASLINGGQPGNSLIQPGRPGEERFHAPPSGDLSHEDKKRVFKEEASALSP